MSLALETLLFLLTRADARSALAQTAELAKTFMQARGHDGLRRIGLEAGRVSAEVCFLLHSGRLDGRCSGNWLRPVAE